MLNYTLLLLVEFPSIFYYVELFFRDAERLSSASVSATADLGKIDDFCNFKYLSTGSIQLANLNTKFDRFNDDQFWPSSTYFGHEKTMYRP